MFEVIIDQTGDRAEAESPEAAAYAALVMADEAKAANMTRGFNPTATFIGPDGNIVASGVGRRDLMWAARV